MTNFLIRVLIILLVFLSLAPWSKYGRKSLVSCIDWNGKVEIRNTRDINALMKVGSDMRVISNDEKVSSLDRCIKCQEPFCSSLIIQKFYRQKKKICSVCAKLEEEKRRAMRKKKQRTILNPF